MAVLVPLSRTLGQAEGRTHGGALGQLVLFLSFCASGHFAGPLAGKYIIAPQFTVAVNCDEKNLYMPTFP
jgi:hypothetical protein